MDSIVPVDSADFVSLDDDRDDDKNSVDDLPDLDDVEVDLGDDSEDTFLETEEEDDHMSDILGGVTDKDDEV
jgi:hypothetical protein